MLLIPYIRAKNCLKVNQPRCSTKSFPLRRFSNLACYNRIK